MSGNIVLKSTLAANDKHPWLQSLRSLSPAYPGLKTLFNSTYDSNPAARDVMKSWMRTRREQSLGRCGLLRFGTDGVDDKMFTSSSDLAAYMDNMPRGSESKERRLWILEDLVPEWMEVIGSRLEFDPLVFAEQSNALNFTDSQTIQTRLPPSMTEPRKSFTLRYFEFRQLQDEATVQSTSNQMTFAANRRRIERWRDIDTPTYKQKWRHSFVRRCASFWTSQTLYDAQTWDAVILVDPPFNSVSCDNDPNTCMILRSPGNFKQNDKLWEARSWSTPGSVIPTIDTSVPYHAGSRTLTPQTMTLEQLKKHPRLISAARNLTSPLDELMLHWKECATQEILDSLCLHSVNAAHFLIRYLGCMWTQHLDLIQATVAQSEYFADDYQARVHTTASRLEWRRRLEEVALATLNINFLRRQLFHFNGHISLNLERLGIVEGTKGIDVLAPLTLRDAQADAINISQRLRSYADRTASLISVANDLTTLHASFKSIDDGQQSLGLTIAASIVFPATLLASIFSMGDEYLPGKDKFWVFWAVTVPVCLMLAGVLFRPKSIFGTSAPL